MSGPRPTPVPISLLCESRLLGRIRRLSRLLDADPAGLGLRVDLPEFPYGTANLRMSHGDEVLVVPSVGPWPLDDLSTRGVQRLVRQLLAEASVGIDVHQEALARHAAIAVAICAAADRLPSPLIGADGTPMIGSVEMCLEHGPVPAFWTEVGDEPVRLDVDPAVLADLAGPMPVPCHAYEHDGELRIGYSASDDDGIHVQVPSIDPVEMIRIHRAVALTTASDPDATGRG